MLNFGAGALVGTRNDITGQTPFRFGALQDVTADLSFTDKPLNGTNQFPILVARGEAKWSIKAKLAVISANAFNALFFGQTLTTGQTALAVDEAHKVPSTSPFVVTPTNSASFVSDQGVSYAGPLGLSLTSTSTAPGGAGIYEPSATAYTFSSSDAGLDVLLNYLYTATTGETISLTNQALGTTPTFAGVFRNRDPQTGLFTTLKINKMTCSKLTFASKTSDWTIPEFDMTVMDDGTGNIGTLSVGDLS
ncbi:MAG: hypothetical protein P4L82_11880 [Ancalomicrobiaceae bacterium]|nr:hypothetical protein [Ancalomicrobiaceae bacterium]